MFLKWMHTGSLSDAERSLAFCTCFSIKLLHLHGFESVVEDEYGCEAEEEALFLGK